LSQCFQDVCIQAFSTLIIAQAICKKIKIENLSLMTNLKRKWRDRKLNATYISIQNFTCMAGVS
jgi:hypothetical protein